MPITECHCPQCQAVFLPTDPAALVCPACGLNITGPTCQPVKAAVAARPKQYPKAAPFAPPPALLTGAKSGRKSGQRKAISPKTAPPAKRPSWVLPVVLGAASLFVLAGIILVVVCVNGSGGGSDDDSAVVVQAPKVAPTDTRPPAEKPPATKAPDPPQEIVPKLDIKPIEDPTPDPPKPKEPTSKEVPPEIDHHPVQHDKKDPTEQVEKPKGAKEPSVPVAVTRPGRGPRKLQLLPDLPVVAPVTYAVLHPPITQPQAQRTLRLAVTPRKYDDMGKLLAGLGKGYQYVEITQQDLYNVTKLTQFDVLFLTCGGSGPDLRLSYALRAFVERGGTLYASDLRYDVLAGAFPDYVDRTHLGRKGVKQAVLANVSDPGLRDLLGDQIELDFNLDGWKPAFFRKDKVQVLLEGRFHAAGAGKVLKMVNGQILAVPGGSPIPLQSPFLVKFAYKKGAVIFTSFHNAAQNNELEQKLLEYLVFTAVTVQV
ncbi:MAG TPA: hypothetical protein VEL76_42965, partial [Gemmataceae bacterium]|nr:hypothetical protein [Gemmataceae bacterium]